MHLQKEKQNCAREKETVAFNMNIACHCRHHS